jgi:hypothetical protein
VAVAVLYEPLVPQDLNESRPDISARNASRTGFPAISASAKSDFVGQKTAANDEMLLTVVF